MLPDCGLVNNRSLWKNQEHKKSKFQISSKSQISNMKTLNWFLVLHLVFGFWLLILRILPFVSRSFLCYN